MTHSDAPATAINSGSDREIPKRVMVAFWLWWPLLIGQAIFVAYFLIAIFVIAAAAGGPGVIAIIILMPVGLVLIALVASEIPLIFRLRRGSRAARGWLLGFAILTGLVAAWQLVATIATMTSLGQSPPEYAVFSIAITVIAVAVAALALVGAVLPFLAPTNDYFAKPPTTGAPPAASSPTTSGPA